MKRPQTWEESMERPLGLNEHQILAAQSLAAGMTWRDTARRAKCSVELYGSGKAR